MGKDDGRHVAVVELRLLQRRVLGRAEEPVAEPSPGRDGHRRQLDEPAHVPDGVDVVDARVLVRVRLDDALAVLPLLDAGLLEPEILDLGRAPDGPEDAVDVQLPVAAVPGRVPHFEPSVAARIRLDPAHVGAPVEVHAEAFVLLGHRVLEQRVERAQELVLPDEQMRLRAQRVQHARHLDGDVAGANDGDPFRLLLELEEAVAGDAVFVAGDISRQVGMSAGGDEDLIGPQVRLLAAVEINLDVVAVEEVCSSVDVLDLLVRKVPLVDAVETLDVGVAFALEGWPVKGCSLLDVEAVRLGLLDRLRDGGSVPDDLLRYAAIGPARQRGLSHFARGQRQAPTPH